MLSNIMHKAKQFAVSLRFSILSIFITLFIITVVLIISFVTFRFEKLLEYTSFSLMNQISTSVVENIKDEMNPIQIQSLFVAELIERGVLNPDKEELFVKYILEIFKALPILESAYWGDEYGNAIVVKKDNNGLITSEIYSQTSSVITHHTHQYDLNGKLIATIASSDVKFDPRSRPWYISAERAKHTTWTDVFITRLNPSLVITAVTPVYNHDAGLRGVVGLTIQLSELFNLLTQQQISPNGFAYIVTKDGKLIAYPGAKSNNKNTFMPEIHSVAQPWIIKSLDYYNATGQEKFNLEFNGKVYLFNYKTIPIIEHNDWLIGVVVPKTDLTNKLEQINFITIINCLVILFFCLIVVSKVVTRIVNPVKILVREANKIKHFDLSSDVNIKSRIKEVIDLSRAFQALKQGLRSFQKYVPKILINQLIETHEDVRIGGTRKELTVLFSDVKDFTAIAETMNPNQLMIYMCEYFEEMTKIISNERGTIDKYIGDSIMAFWGAPLPEKFSSQQAVYAALTCQNKLDQLNAKWVKQGRPILMTRIGIHAGDAIVGNLGSSERLNYTALGDTINIASRLEKLNKIYGTKIIVSDTVYKEVCNQFIFRMIDCVTIRGKMNSTNIYELVCENIAEISFDIYNYRTVFTYGFSAYQHREWDHAIEYFKQCISIYSGDTIAPIFIKRCEQFKIHPPLDPWNGIWKLME